MQRMSKSLRMGLAILFLLVGSFAVLRLYWDFERFEGQTAVHRSASLNGALVGDEKIFIRSRFDLPYFVVAAPEPSFTNPSSPHGPVFVTEYYEGPANSGLQDLPDGAQVEGYDFWGYIIYQLTFDPETDRLIAISCGPFDPVEFETEQKCASAFGVEIGDSELVVESKLGPPSSPTGDVTGATTLRYDDIGVEFRLNDAKQVTAIRWFAPQGGTGAIVRRYIKARWGI